MSVSFDFARACGRQVSQRLDCCSHAKRAAAKRGGLRSRSFRLLEAVKQDLAWPCEKRLVDGLGPGLLTAALPEGRADRIRQAEKEPQRRSLKRVDTVTPVLGAGRRQEQCRAAPLSAAAFLRSR